MINGVILVHVSYNLYHSYFQNFEEHLGFLMVTLLPNFFYTVRDLKISVLMTFIKETFIFCRSGVEDLPDWLVMHPLVHRATDLQVCPRPVGHPARPLTPNPQCQELTAHLLVCFNYFKEFN